jgi:hypothetical protein
MKYREIVFIQGEEANEPLDILNNEGEEKAMEYLQQWDYGNENLITEHEQPFGTTDILYKKDNYIMSYNKVGYVGLVEVIKE